MKSRWGGGWGGAGVDAHESRYFFWWGGNGGGGSDGSSSRGNVFF